MSLEEVTDAVNAAYRDSLVHRVEQGELTTSEPRAALAALMLSEVRDLYDPASSDENNLSRIVTGLQFAGDELQMVAQRLKIL